MIECLLAQIIIPCSAERSNDDDMLGVVLNEPIINMCRNPEGLV